MDSLIAQIEAPDRRKNLPSFRVGDIVRVHQRIREGGKERLQVFEGIVLARKHGEGLNGTFTVRRIASGVGVEKIFPLHSPTIAKIERLRSSKVRRAKLYFLRERVGRKARLKGWEAYASWSEEPALENLSDAEGEEKSEVKDEIKDEEVLEANEPAENLVDSDQEKGSDNDSGASQNGENGGGRGDETLVEEGSQDSSEKPED